MATYLPEEIIIRILSRLPVKSLLSFKSVCKSWYNLIDQPTLIDMHLAQSINDSNNDKERESFLVINSDKTIRKHVVHLLTQETYNDFVYLNIPYERYACITLLGCCNGLLCVCARKNSHAAPEYFIVNPATRESKAICRTSHNSDSKASYGFGFVPVNNDYKLVIVKGFMDSAGKSWSRAEVWTLGMDSWRGLDNVVEGELQEVLCKAVLNGALHWMAVRKRREEYPKILILYFDLSNEVFGEIMGPNFNYGLHASYLSVCQGSLAMFVAYKDESLAARFDIWLMNEYGVRASWTKQFTIKPMIIEKPLGFGKNGEMLVALKDGFLGLYDQFTGGVKALPIQAQYGALYLLNYVESLVQVVRRLEFQGRFDFVPAI